LKLQEEVLHNEFDLNLSIAVSAILEDSRTIFSNHWSRIPSVYDLS